MFREHVSRNVRKRGRPPDSLPIGGYDKPNNDESTQIPVHQSLEAPRQLPLPSIRELESDVVVRKHSPRRCRLGGPKGPKGVFKAFERSKNASLKKGSTDANIISVDLFESGVDFSESSIHNLSRDVFLRQKKC